MTIMNTEKLRGSTVKTSDGTRIGKVAEVYLDDHSGLPEWVAVKTGFFGSKQALVPLAAAEEHDGDLKVPFDKQRVQDAPHYDTDERQLSPAEEASLYNYYGLSYAEQATVDAEQRTAASPPTDDAMTRSEERLRVRTESRETGRARLRKYVTTETETVEVPVSKERVRVEREPITADNQTAAMSGPTITEQEHEITLSEERPVVSTETTPVERVRLEKEVETGTEQVSGEVRKEHIETPETDAPPSDH